MESSKIKVRCLGIRAIMFDRFVDMKTEIAPQDKVYFNQDDYLVFPALNISSFLSAENTESAPKRIMGKKWKTIAKAALSFVNIVPFDIPILSNGELIKKDSKQIRITHHKAVIKKGQLAIPSPKDRPLLDLPWELNFELELFKNPDLNENTLKKLFIDGGIMIGFGTYRGVFGKFIVDKWEVLN